MNKIIGTIVLMFLVFAWNQASLNRMASDSLSRQESFVERGIFFDSRVTYSQGEYQNVALAQNALGRAQRTDLNKSKLIGVWAGNKSKEFIAGFIEGRKIVRSKVNMAQSNGA